MESDAATVLQEALALSDRDRAGIAAELLASLPGPKGGLEVDSDEWLREIEGRARSARSGDTIPEDWATVEHLILRKLSSR
ncbi:MAG TPA: hypothetical protein VFW71_03190 [Actinomycetota bacterium]|nr:hypothetical protein [Actinomycetota bacterium]